MVMYRHLSYLISCIKYICKEGILHKTKKNISTIVHQVWNTFYTKTDFNFKRKQSTVWGWMGYPSSRFTSPQCRSSVVAVHTSLLLHPSHWSLTPAWGSLKACFTLTRLPWQSATSCCCIPLGFFQATLMCFWPVYLLKRITCCITLACSCQKGAKHFRFPWHQKKSLWLLTCLPFGNGHWHLPARKGQVQVRGLSSTGRSCMCSLHCWCLHQPVNDEKERTQIRRKMPTAAKSNI